MNAITKMQLDDSKLYVKNGMSFMHPKVMVDPFLDIMKYSDSDELTITTQNEVVNENEDKSENIAYPRFGVQISRKVVDEDLGIDYDNVSGMIVALDVNKPIVKVYTGFNAKACLNLCIFNASDTYSQDVLQDFANMWEVANKYYNREQEKLNELTKAHEQLHNVHLRTPEVNELLGRLLRQGRTVIGTNPIVNASRLLDDNKSMYHYKDETTLYNVYQSITQGITDSKEIIAKPDKTVAVAKLLGVLNLN